MSWKNNVIELVDGWLHLNGHLMNSYKRKQQEEEAYMEELYTAMNKDLLIRIAARIEEMKEDSYYSSVAKRISMLKKIFDQLRKRDAKDVRRDVMDAIAYYTPTESNAGYIRGMHDFIELMDSKSESPYVYEIYKKYKKAIA